MLAPDESPRAMHQRWRCRVRKLTDRSGDPKPNCRTGAVTIRCEFVRAFGSSSHRLLAVVCKHEVGDAPYVDFGDHDEGLAGDPVP